MNLPLGCKTSFALLAKASTSQITGRYFYTVFGEKKKSHSKIVSKSFSQCSILAEVCEASAGTFLCKQQSFSHPCSLAAPPSLLRLNQFPFSTSALFVLPFLHLTRSKDSLYLKRSFHSAGQQNTSEYNCPQIVPRQNSCLSCRR